MNPEVMNELASLAVAAMSLVITIATPIVAMYVRRYTGIKIEEKHMRVIHEAAMTWAHDAVKRGVGPASANAADDFKDYLYDSAPDAFNNLVKKDGVLRKIANRYLMDAVERFTPFNSGPAPAK